ncbi:helix-turn-helix transcriptional regulator [Myxacorys almedinensis]|uniref:Helix-turn-helix domain-containing protein n=1 Tax=Myxacorys almedinensis A TaxID=2690445 RepID=A0A8J8CIH5_9CYAN|nr:AraC family transcriptional regulator [Myxacorys almedinensis]NDJ17704.1 helix-turn-helix domain-containing protein [Myxacorys almedinensis A]
MPMRLSGEAYDQMLSPMEAPFDPEDEFDQGFTVSPLMGEGYSRSLELREGLEIRIEDHRLWNGIQVEVPESKAWLNYHFHLSGQHQDRSTEVDNNQFALYGSGFSPSHLMIAPSNCDPLLEVHINMHPDFFRSFVGNRQGELPTELRSLVRPSDQLQYTRVGTISPTIQRLLWQILRCPYQGTIKRMFLEGKALEVSALVLEEETAIQKGQSAPLKIEGEERDRIHRAREILIQQLDHPPSIVELAQQVGLNSRALKEGFRQQFGKPAFAYLHEYRLEQARQLLESEEMKVSEVAQAIGFANRSHFAEAFRKKFGVNPKDYQMQRRKLFVS